jgi:ATP-dependent Lhr-like helicase
VILRDGALLGYMGRTEKSVLTFLPDEEPERGHAAEDLGRALAALVEEGRRKTLLVSKIDGEEAARSPLGPVLVRAGFTSTMKGFFARARAAGRP